jgi:hypothetical protein
MIMLPSGEIRDRQIKIISMFNGQQEAREVHDKKTQDAAGESTATGRIASRSQRSFRGRSIAL